MEMEPKARRQEDASRRSRTHRRSGGERWPLHGWRAAQHVGLRTWRAVRAPRGTRLGARSRRQS